MSIALPEETKKIYKINQVPTITGLSLRESAITRGRGLIKPVREPNTNDRLFSEFDIKQIKRIKALIHKRAFTIPALKQLLVIAPGSNIFRCEDKENCQAFKNSHKRYWEDIKKVDGIHYEKYCTICPLYLGRKTRPMKIVEKPKSA